MTSVMLELLHDDRLSFSFVGIALLQPVQQKHIPARDLDLNEYVAGDLHVKYPLYKTIVLFLKSPTQWRNGTTYGILELRTVWPHPNDAKISSLRDLGGAILGLKSLRALTSFPNSHLCLLHH